MDFTDYKTSNDRTLKLLSSKQKDKLFKICLVILGVGFVFSLIFQAVEKSAYRVCIRQLCKVTIK